MRIIECTQGEDDWKMAKLGIPSASEFSKIVTPTGKLSKQAKEYAYRLIGEELTQEIPPPLDNLYWIGRGKILEPEAVDLYEFERGVKTTKIGFITNDAGTVGCSPDRFTSDGGIIEIKCPSAGTHISYLIEGFDQTHKPQVQGQLLITDLSWCEWFSFHPNFQPKLMRIERDEEYIKVLSEALDEFVEMKKTLLAEIRAKGFFDQRLQDAAE